MHESGTEVSLIFFYGTVVCLLFVTAVGVFAFIYQNKMLRHQNELRVKEEEKQRQLLEAIIQGQEKEQKRVSQELHDGVGADLAAVKLHCYAARKHLNENEKSVELFLNASNMLDEVISNVRNMSHRLSPSVLEKFGLVNVLESMANRISETKEANVIFQSSVSLPSLTNSQSLMVYRIIQELVQNSLKHGKATEVKIFVSGEKGKCKFEVSDNGKGFLAEKGNENYGIGLRNIESRVQVLQAKFEIDSKPGEGTKAILIL